METARLEPVQREVEKGMPTLRKAKQRLGRFLIPRLPMTRHVFNHFRWELDAWWVRLNSRLNPFYVARRIKIKSGDNLSVNVACGGGAREGWINLDLMIHKNLSLRHDCRKGLPLRKESARRIRCEHFLEHLDREEEAPFFLKSCFECLKTGGILRVVVPDAGRFLLAYPSGKKEDWAALGWNLDELPQGFHTPMDIINHVFRQREEHAYAYDFETLSRALRQAGFREIRKCEFGVSPDPQLCGDLPEHRLYSLYVEAVK